MTAPHLVFAQNGGPIRIGMLAVKTGPLASGGIDMELGMTMFLKERDNTLAGRKVELIVADTTGAPATARAKAQELVEKNDVHCIIGPLAAFEALAIADYLKEKEMPTLNTRKSSLSPTILPTDMRCAPASSARSRTMAARLFKRSSRR
jgi:branched-chain amino acid transport system substrate-binding protein